MAQGDIRLVLDDLHADFKRKAPGVVVTARLDRFQEGEVIDGTPEQANLGSVEVRVEYPTKAAFWAAGTGLRDALIAEFRKDQRVAQKSIQ